MGQSFGFDAAFTGRKLIGVQYFDLESLVILLQRDKLPVTQLDDIANGNLY